MKTENGFIPIEIEPREGTFLAKLHQSNERIKELESALDNLLDYRWRRIPGGETDFCQCGGAHPDTPEGDVWYHGLIYCTDSCPWHKAAELLLPGV